MSFKTHSEKWILEALALRWHSFTTPSTISLPDNDDQLHDIVKIAVQNCVDGSLAAILIENGHAKAKLTKYLSIPGLIREKVALRDFDQVKSILQEFKNSNIDNILLKGWAFTAILYAQDPLQRFSSDVDILVNPQQIDNAIDVLHRLGYHTAENEPWPNFNFRFGYSANYTNPNWITVGLHSGLIPMLLPQLKAWQELKYRCNEIIFNGLYAQTLSPEDTIVYLSAHLALHHQYHSAIFRYYDIALMITKPFAIDWDRVVLTSAQWGCVLALQNTLNCINDIWNDIIPAQVLEQLQKIKVSRHEKRVHYWAAEHDHTPFSNFITWLLNQKNILQQIRFLSEITFPSIAYMQKRYGEKPRGLNWVLYFKRWANALQTMR